MDIVILDKSTLMTCLTLVKWAFNQVGQTKRHPWSNGHPILPTLTRHPTFSNCSSYVPLIPMQTI
jgi:hypothetical protein